VKYFRAIKALFETNKLSFIVMNISKKKKYANANSAFLWRYDTQLNDTQPNDTQNKGLIFDTA
jgi:hypothetical protein